MVAAWPARFIRGEGGDLRVMDPASIAVDTPALLFALAASVATAAVFGVGPALRASRSDPQEACDSRQRRRLGPVAQGEFKVEQESVWYQIRHVTRELETGELETRKQKRT